MYNSEDYINYQNFNEIEGRIETLTNYINNNNIATIPSFNKKTWVLNEIPYVEEINRIETGIDNLGKCFFKPDGWIKTRQWNLFYNDSEGKNVFDYKDINRWISNLNLIDENKNKEFIIWNGQSFIYWDEQYDEDWS
jgi:hypothetical protein